MIRLRDKITSTERLKFGTASAILKITSKLLMRITYATQLSHYACY